MKVLPLEEHPGHYPFTSMVLNVNALLDAHRDPQDDRYCVVIPIGDFTGGDLVLYEPRISIALESGCPVIMNSKLLTHFNQHYKGKRASLVLHVDKLISSYIQSRPVEYMM